MHLCPQNAAKWRGPPRLLSRACKFSSALEVKAYTASGQAVSTLHAMAILQVYQAKVLKDLHEGVPDPELLQELCSVTGYALRTMKVMAQALGRPIYTMVVQEHHLWLNLVEMQDSEKVRFLDALISQKQTEAIKHILPQRVASASLAPPRQQPPPAQRRGRPPARTALQQAGPAARPAQEGGTARPSTGHKELLSGFKAFLRWAAQVRQVGVFSRLAEPPQSLSLASQDHLTRLCDSIHKMPAQNAVVLRAEIAIE
ncbi:hypothetical protein M9458_034942 [Cirrhinus mrigala]|uniref:Uncharacterized protein n=1 Tax=Cirrhinus mrigala TaxID=683832 RepID=A0ABD0PAP0_CIRMR